jgi:hypothetical protein
MGFNFSFASFMCAQPIAGGLALGAVAASSIVASGNVSAARFLGGAGTDALPTFSFTADPNTGIYNDAADSFAGTAGAAKIFDVTSVDGIGATKVIANQFGAGDGDATNPAFYFLSDTNCGFTRAGADLINVVGGGGYGGLVAGIFTAASYFAGPAVYLSEGTAQPATANYSILYSLDVGAKTQLTAKQGAAGTVVPLAIEV